MPGLPDYKVKTSERARRVRLHLSPDDGLTVIVPKRFDWRKIPGIVEEKRDWIERNLKRFDRLLRDAGADGITDVMPDVLTLAAIGEEWRVDYFRASGDKITLREIDGFTIELAGAIADVELCGEMLRDFLACKAKSHLVPTLNDVASRLGMEFEGVTVRSQNTRWGSCSSRKNISLNLKLLFLPDVLVNYVMVHELCHTVHPNHSKEFWSLVELHDPDWKSHRKTLKDAMFTHVPKWLRAMR